MEWITRTKASRHFHIRRRSDLQRMARLLTGRGNGLVLSGGGARGLAHIGVARALEEHQFNIDIVMGTSIGALIGAGIALEWEPEALRERADQFCRANQFLEITFPRLSLLAGRHVKSSLRKWFGDLQIEDTPVPYSCVSTKLNTAESVTHEMGSLQTWTRASAAVPGVFPPVMDGDMVHVDGGVLNNMPSDLIRRQGAGFVLGVDVGAGATSQGQDISEALSKRVPLNILELLIRVGCLGDEARWGSRRQECDVLIVPPLANFGLLNFKLYEQIIEIGYQAARAALTSLPASLPAAPGLSLAPEVPAKQLAS
jgi:NTE family protein